MKKRKKIIIITSAAVAVVAVAAVVLGLLFGGRGGEETEPPVVVEAAPKTYVVKYDSNGGAPVKDGEYTVGEKFILPIPGSGSDAKMYGYSFTSWFYDTEGKEAAKVPLDVKKAKDGVFTLHAGWTNMHTVYFDTRTAEVIEPKQYAFGDRIPASDLPRATDRKVGNTPVPFAHWVNSSNGQIIKDDFRMEGTDVYLYATYDTGVSPHYEMLEDGTYKGLRTQAWSTYKDWQVGDGQTFSMDMIMPANPGDFGTSTATSGAGPVFAATGFNSENNTFVGNYYIWMQIVRSTANAGLACGIRFWGYRETDIAGSTQQSLGFYHLNGMLKNTPYGKKMTAYLNGEYIGKETRLHFTFRRVDTVWYIGIDGVEYFTFEPGQPITPAPAKPDEGGASTSTKYAGGYMVGMRSDITEARFANFSLVKSSSLKQDPANRHKVTFETGTSQKFETRSYYPGEMVSLPDCDDRVINGQTYKFLYWVDKSTSRPLEGSFRMPTYDIQVFARYDTGTTAAYELLEDGTYKPTKEPQAMTTYKNLKVQSGQMYSVEMVLPRDPKKFGTSATTGGAGPVFAASGFSESKSTFTGYYYVWVQIVRSTASGVAPGGVRFWGYSDGHSASEATQSLAFYKLSGSVLKKSKYAEKMNAYLKGGVQKKDTVISFTFRRQGNVWYIGLEGEELFTFEVRKPVTPKPSGTDEGGTLLASSRYAGQSLVGFRSDIIDARFRNPKVENYDASEYQRTLSFDTRTDEKIASKTVTAGDTIKASDLPKPAKQFETTDGKKYDFDCWVDPSTGKPVGSTFTVTDDTELYAHYKAGTTTAFEVQKDGSFLPNPTAASGAVWSGYNGMGVEDGQVFSVDMTLPSDPNKFTSGGGSGAGPIFAASAFNEKDSTFVGGYYVWMQIVRRDTAKTLEKDVNAGGIRFWGFHEGEKIGGAHDGTKDLAFYTFASGGFLNGTPYGDKIRAYFAGTLKGDVTLHFTFRREGDVWHIGIDGVEYFTFTPGELMNPPSTEKRDVPVSSGYAGTKLIGFRTNIAGVSFSGIEVKPLGVSETGSVTLDYKDGKTTTTATYPKGTNVLLPRPGDLTQDGKKFSFACWVDSATGKQVTEPYKVEGEANLYARYNGAVKPSFTVGKDGTYKPNAASSSQTTYSDWKLEDGQMFSIDMVMPKDPSAYTSTAGAGLVFAATGFDADKSTFAGNYFVRMEIVRANNATAGLPGSLHIFGYKENSDTAEEIAFYKFNQGSYLKGTPFDKKMSAYLTGGATGKETRFTFNVRREGGVWYIGIDGVYYFSFSVEGGMGPASSAGGDLTTAKVNSGYAGATMVGLQGYNVVTFANPVITTFNPEDYKGTLTFDTKTDETVAAQTAPLGAEVTLPAAKAKSEGGKSYPFVCWVDAKTGRQVTSPYVVTGDTTLYARYSGAVTPSFTLQKDGTYKPGKANVDITYSDWKLEDGQVFSFDMIMPSDPKNFGPSSGAGPIFTATGFNGDTSKFAGGNYYIWMHIVRGTQTSGLAFGIQFFGWLEGKDSSAAQQELGFYQLKEGCNLTDTAYGKKMTGYFNGELKGQQVKLSFTIRRDGDTWHIGIDGVEYFTIEPGKTISPAIKGTDTSKGKINSTAYKGASGVGFRANTANVTFANPVITDAGEEAEQAANGGSAGTAPTAAAPKNIFAVILSFFAKLLGLSK